MNYNAASPAGMRALGNVHDHVRRSGLPARLIDLVFLRVSQINGCAYCIDTHSHDLLKGGLPVEHLMLVAVWRESERLFREEEKAALAWAKAVTRLGDHGVPESAFESVAAVFDENQLADLTIAIALINAYNRIAISFGAGPGIVQRTADRELHVDKAAEPQSKENVP